MDMLTFADKSVFEKSIFDQVTALEFNFKQLRKNKIEKYQSKPYLRKLIDWLAEYQEEGREIV